ncbi:MAG: hypothetical protein HYY06_04880 [Deltaproteobacteria bacterium]|nr:hypothetical protein [Deltaproteobacteria bacterium]
MTLRTGLAVVLAAVVTAATGSAGAQSKLVLAQPVMPEAVPVAVQRQVVVQIAEGLVESGLDVGVDPFPAGACVSGSCLIDMARAHGAAAVVLTAITGEGRNYRIEMKLVDGRDGRTVGRIQAGCDFCAYDELGRTALGAARQLVAQRPRPPSGRPPLRLVRRAEPSGPGAIPWIAVGGGVALVVAGVVLLTMDGDCSSSNADGTCRDRTNLKWPAAAALGGGALLFGAGSATILFAPARDPRDPRGRVAGASVSVSWSF